MEINPTKNFIFYGLMRSGNHAIIKWVSKAIIGNDITPFVGTRIYYSYNETDKLVFFNDISRTHTELRKVVNNFSKYDYKLASVEDEYLPLYKSEVSSIMPDNITKRVFIFRNIEDCYRSRKALFGDNFITVDTFKRFAKLEEECNKLTEKTIIIYDKWLISETYRKEILIELGILDENKFTDDIDNMLKLPDKITSGPGTSSFK